MGANVVLEAVRSELPHYPGVEMDATDRGGNHRRVVFRHGGLSRFLVIPRTASDWRAPKNAVRELRRAMEEIGAKRVDQPDAVAIQAKRAVKSGKAKVATVSLRDKIFVVHIGVDSKLIDRFKTADNRPAAHWTFSLSPSPDLAAPPLIVAKKVDVRPGGKRHGAVGGFAVVGGSWRLTVARSQVPALAKLPNFKGVGVRLYEDRGDELVFQLPAGTVPTGFRKPDEAPVAAPEPIEAKAPVQPETKPVSPEPVAVDIGDRPLVLQMPKQSVSIEQAIAVLNRAKRRLGSNLRFQIVEDGFLTATHRIGQ